jgi:hypothetical protein
MKFRHIMVDNETLGTVADAVIMSLGAIKFDLDSDAIDDNGFYASISIDSNLEAKRRTQEDTLIWWMKQTVAAQGVFHESKDTLVNALTDFADWIGDDAANVCMWSNGADFDLPMLQHAYVQHGMEVPWKFWNNRCFRTYKNLPHARQVKYVGDGVKHNALADAHNQAKHLQLIQRVVTGKEPFKQNSMVKTA